MDKLWESLGSVLGLMLVGALVLLLDRVRAKVSDWLEKRRLNPLVRGIRYARDVQAMLLELRVQLGADRAYVILFHNGSYFSNKNPVWRVSCLVEVCKPGIAHDMTSVQGVLASNIWHVLAPAFDEQYPGVYDMKNGVKRVVVKEMPDSYSKEWLRSKGICGKVMVPLRDKNGQVCGIVAVNYDNAQCENCMLCSKNHQIMVDYSARIKYSLEK
jgi:hypothetical protein